MLNIVLFELEILLNIGNIICLCVNMGFSLYIIELMGFIWDDKCLRCVGLDYYEFIVVQCYVDYVVFVVSVQLQCLFVLIIKGMFVYSVVSYQDGDFLMFGLEICGLLVSIFDVLLLEQKICILMMLDSCSMNLLNVVLVVVYEVWCQLGYSGVVLCS